MKTKYVLVFLLVIVIVVGLMLYKNNSSSTSNTGNKVLPDQNLNKLENNNLNQNPTQNSNENLNLNLNIKEKNESSETIILDDKTSEVSTSEKIENDSPTIRNYGAYSFDIFKNHPEILKEIKKVKSDFKEDDVGTSYPTKSVIFNGKNFLIISGCTPHDCGGTVNVIVYDVSQNKAYVLRENSSQTEVTIYGNPDQEIKKLLIYSYYHS